MAASAEGFRYAAAHPAEAAKLFVQAANAAHPARKEPREEGMCTESIEYVAPVSDQGGGKGGWVDEWVYGRGAAGWERPQCGLGPPSGGACVRRAGAAFFVHLELSFCWGLC